MSMSVIDQQPQGSIELRAYAGDTFSFKIIVDTDYTGYTWSGQIRSNYTDQVVDTTFDFSELTVVPPVPPEVPEIPTWEIYVSLSSDKTQLLADLIDESLVESDIIPIHGIIVGSDNVQVSTHTYSGVWDIQVESGNVVRTLVKGTIIIDTDVTRDG